MKLLSISAFMLAVAVAVAVGTKVGGQRATSTSGPRTASTSGPRATPVRWSRPFGFGRLAGWHTGASGNIHVRFANVRESTAWAATNNVRYRDKANADPPFRTLHLLPPSGVIVWAAIYAPAERRQRAIRLDLRDARPLAFSEGEGSAGLRLTGRYAQLTGHGPRGAYSVIVRVYFGSAPTKALRSKAQAALNHLRLPPPRR